jgi:hypothetical protein
MARRTGIGYSGSLNLNRVTGIRADSITKQTSIQQLLKPNSKLPRPTPARKTVANITRDGLKK